MRTLARELAPEMIRVNTIHPTGVDSTMSINDYFPKSLSEHEELGNAMRFNPMPVEMLPMADVSGVVAFLCSDDSKWITGRPCRSTLASSSSSPARPVVHAASTRRVSAVPAVEGAAPHAGTCSHRRGERLDMPGRRKASAGQVHPITLSAPAPA